MAPEIIVTVHKIYEATLLTSDENPSLFNIFSPTFVII